MRTVIAVLLIVGVVCAGTSVGSRTYVGTHDFTGATVVGISGGSGTTNQNIRNVTMTFDGGGMALSGTLTTCTKADYSGTLTGISIASDVSNGSATVDVQTESWATYKASGPSTATSIKGSGATPALSSAWGADPSISGFNTSIAAGTAVCFVLTGPSNATKISTTLAIAAN